MIQKWKTTFPAPTGTEERRVYLYLPESYENDTNKRYPVLYMFDGHNVFFDSDATYGKCWGMKEYMDFTNTEMIIVAVECNHSPNNGRLQEYSPFDFVLPDQNYVEGYGRETMEWFVHTLKEEIDQNYRTLRNREHTFIAGSSMGGLMSLYAVIEYNHVFSRAAALSPSIWTNTMAIERMIKQKRLRKNTVIYMDYGSNEIKHHQIMRREFERITALLLRKKVMLTSRIVPFGDHCEACWERQIPFFMETLLYQSY